MPDDTPDHWPAPDVHDSFHHAVARSGVEVKCEPIACYPRDVLAAPETEPQHFLVTLIAAESAGERAPQPLQVIFTTGVDNADVPTARDVLWWVVGEAWVVERSGRDVTRWAAFYRHPETPDLDSAATARLFGTSLRQTEALGTLLGADRYQHLIRAYGEAVSDAPVRWDGTAR